MASSIELDKKNRRNVYSFDPQQFDPMQQVAPGAWHPGMPLPAATPTPPPDPKPVFDPTPPLGTQHWPHTPSAGTALIDPLSPPPPQDQVPLSSAVKHLPFAADSTMSTAIAPASPPPPPDATAPAAAPEQTPPSLKYADEGDDELLRNYLRSKMTPEHLAEEADKRKQDDQYLADNNLTAVASKAASMAGTIDGQQASSIYNPNFAKERVANARGEDRQDEQDKEDLYRYLEQRAKTGKATSQELAKMDLLLAQQKTQSSHWDAEMAQKKAELDQKGALGTQKNNINQQAVNVKAAKSTDDSGKQAYKRATDIRSQTMKSPLLKSYTTVETAYRDMTDAAQNPSAGADLKIVYNFMKILDPNAVVREGAKADATNASGVPDQIRNQWNRLIDGEKLNPAQVKDFLAQATVRRNIMKTAVENFMDSQDKIGSSYGLDPTVYSYRPNFGPEPSQSAPSRPVPGHQEADVAAYAKAHNITYDQAAQVKRSRMGQ